MYAVGLHHYRHVDTFIRQDDQTVVPSGRSLNDCDDGAV